MIRVMEFEGRNYRIMTRDDVPPRVEVEIKSWRRGGYVHVWRTLPENGDKAKRVIDAFNRKGLLR